MTTAEVISLIAACFTGLGLLVMVAEKLWGGGNALATKFHKLETDTTAAVTAVRSELNDKIDEYEKVGTVGFEAIRANIHEMQMGLLQFRATTAEGLHSYIRKDDYNVGVADIKRDMQNGFRAVDDRLGQLQDLIMYSNPDAPKPHLKLR